MVSTIGLSGLRLAEVRSLDDYFKSGRVKIRFYGVQDDEQNVKDENLTEAMVVMPVTSASTGKVGTAPTGLVVGSRVIVGYAAGDTSRRTPIIMGSYYRGAEPKDRDPKTATGGRDEIKKGSEGVDTPGAANPGLNTAGYSFHNIGLKLNPFNTKDDKYNNAQFTENNSGKKDIKTAREQFAPNADLPTTASADPSQKLPEVLNQVDPQKLSMGLMQLFSALAMVRNLMNSASPAPRRKTITDALSGALCILTKEFGFDRVIEVMNAALENDGLNIISPDYQEIVKNAVAELIAKAAKFGVNNIPIKTYPIIQYPVVNRLVLPGLIVDVVPDLYLQQYYPIESDPYPGYIHYMKDNTSVFVKRVVNQPTYTSADEEIYAVCEQELAEDLRPHFVNKDLTAELLNLYLNKQDNNVQNNGMEKAMGKNSGVNIMGLLPQLLGILGSVVNNTLSQHLPVSVLNQGAINQSMEKFSKNMAQLKKMKADSLPAFNLPGGLSNMIGALGGGLGGIANLAGTAGLGNVAGALGGAAGLAGNLAGNLNMVTNALGGAGGLGQLTGVISNVNNITSNIPNISVNSAVNVSSIINKIAR